jgi:hypothetical protein
MPAMELSRFDALAATMHQRSLCRWRTKERFFESNACMVQILVPALQCLAFAMLTCICAVIWLCCGQTYARDVHAGWC